MNIKDVKELILTIDKTSVQKVDLETSDMKISISKTVVAEDRVYEMKDPEIKKTVKNVEENIKEIVQKDVEEDTENTYMVKSPIVGVFYSSPSPDSEPFVKVGDKVKKGQSLCIVEAMKMMNEIECEEEGEVVEILLNNEDTVEYGQPLMKIRR